LFIQINVEQLQNETHNDNADVSHQLPVEPPIDKVSRRYSKTRRATRP
jgi:hypothetical protein